jgi:hypothetical protein
MIIYHGTNPIHVFKPNINLHTTSQRIETHLKGVRGGTAVLHFRLSLSASFGQLEICEEMSHAFSTTRSHPAVVTKCRLEIRRCGEKSCFLGSAVCAVLQS